MESFQSPELALSASAPSNDLKSICQRALRVLEKRCQTVDISFLLQSQYQNRWVVLLGTQYCNSASGRIQISEFVPMDVYLYLLWDVGEKITSLT